jgi:hypothetical protein
MPAIRIQSSIFNGIIATALEEYVQMPVDPASITLEFESNPVAFSSAVLVKYQPKDSVVPADMATDDELWYFGRMMLEMSDRHGVGMLRIHLKTARDLGLMPGIHEGRINCSKRVTIEKALGLLLTYVYVGSQDIDKASEALAEARKLLNS